MTHPRGEACVTGAPPSVHLRRADPVRLRHTVFGGMDVTFDDRVIEPRPWTMLQSEWAIEVADSLPAGPVVEVCCGAGHIGQVVAAKTGRRLVQFDASPVACRHARLNARNNGLLHLVDVHCARVDGPGDLERAGPVRPPLILADPPYLPTDDCDRYPQDPPLAIDGGIDGLGPTRAIVTAIAHHLADDGVALLQLRGPAQVQRLVDDGLVDDGLVGLVCTEVRTVDRERAVARLHRAIH